MPSSPTQSSAAMLFVIVLVMHGGYYQLTRAAATPECVSTSDCPPTSCCVIGRARFATPWCQPYRQLGEECRPQSAEPVASLNLTYPGGRTLYLKNVHDIMCPCDRFLYCDERQGRCLPLKLSGPVDNDVLDQEFDLVDDV